MRGILHYNEDKVLSGEAQLIVASGFAGDIDKMSLVQKFNRFKHLTELNIKVKTNALHISLNFDSTDKLDNSKLQKIAAEYMERIGFGDQPFLVYRHYDANHPHIHIATTNIKKDGERIDIHGIGYRLSEPARKELELKFGLLKAEGREIKLGQSVTPAIYGEKPTKQVISNTVTGVMRQYCYTSFAEYKAILEQFNIRADRGAEDTRMFEKRGLLYSIIDAKGEPKGVPIKASQIYCKPTLDELEKRFERNQGKRKPFKAELKDELDKLFFKFGNMNKEILKTELLKSSIDVVFRTNDKGQLYGITYIDHRNKTIFNGSDLGKAYSAKALSERFENASLTIQKPSVTVPQQISKTSNQQINLPKTFLKTPSLTNFLDIALARTEQESGIKMPKRKKKRKGQVTEQDQQLTL
jgi:hypothetical protein